MIGGETTMNLNDFRHAEHIVLEEQTLPMNALDEAGPILSASIDDRIEAACDRIAPVWPLDRFVAVNPFHGLRHERFQQAARRLRHIADARMYMPHAYYHQQITDGRIDDEALRIAAARCGSDLDPAAIAAALAEAEPAPAPGVPLLTAVLDEMEADQWSSFVVDRISHHCASYFDMGQATWKQPWQGTCLYQSWRRFAELDYSVAMMGISGMRRRISTLPQAPRDCIAWALRRLGIPEAGVTDYLHAALLDIGGWAAWTRLLRWEQELAGGSDDTIVELLAIRLAWDALLYEHKKSLELAERWREVCARLEQPVADEPWQHDHDLAHVLLTAMEIGYQRRLAAGLAARAPAQSGGEPAVPVRPAVQAAFCIDVRSEIMRRALETVSPKVQTLGFAGFFGVPIETVPFGSTQARSHVPVLLTPSYRVCTEIDGADESETAQAKDTQRRRVGIGKSWKAFKMGAPSCFSFVEAAGLLLYAPKIIADSLGLTRPVAAPDDLHIDRDLERRARPSLAPAHPGGCAVGHDHDHGVGIPEADRVSLAETILRAMSMTESFGRLVLLVGHGSTTVNNPHATGLDCGACAGQTGEASARVVATLLNDPAVRRGLDERGIRIPEDTWFLGALHDTCTDDVRLFDTDDLGPEHREAVIEVQDWLEQAGALTRMQRSALLGLDGRSRRAVDAGVRRRSRDWSQVRPEWGLAGCAAFIAAPRERSRGLDLGGRTFLHDYDWRADDGFGVLELIMTAPMVVAAWINLQYYGSTTDNRRFGSGNKVLHNVVGGAIGVIEGNAGDLRVGLPMQSLHDGTRWIHEPVRLSVFLQAPQHAIDDIIARHELVRQLVDNGWLHLFRIEDESGAIDQRLPGQGWEPVPTG
jgi:hypothetical protein